MVLFGAIILLAVAAGVLTVTQPWRRPSQELVGLQSVESQLVLPKSDERKTVDLGKYQGEKGETRYDRHIINSYKTTAPVQAVITALPGKGWVQINSAEYQGVQAYYFVSLRAQACVTTRLAPASKDPFPNSVILYSRYDDACKDNF